MIDNILENDESFNLTIRRTSLPDRVNPGMEQATIFIVDVNG